MKSEEGEKENHWKKIKLGKYGISMGAVWWRECQTALRDSTSRKTDLTDGAYIQSWLWKRRSLAHRSFLFIVDVVY